MESDHELTEKIIALLQEVTVDLQINNNETNGQISLLFEKCQSEDYGDVAGALKEVQSISYLQGFNDGLLQMTRDIVKLMRGE